MKQLIRFKYLALAGLITMGYGPVVILENKTE